MPAQIASPLSSLTDFMSAGSTRRCLRMQIVVSVSFRIFTIACNVLNHKWKRVSVPQNRYVLFRTMLALCFIRLRHNIQLWVVEGRPSQGVQVRFQLTWSTFCGHFSPIFHISGNLGHKKYGFHLRRLLVMSNMAIVRRTSSIMKSSAMRFWCRKHTWTMNYMQCTDAKTRIATKKRLVVDVWMLHYQDLLN